MTWAHYLIWTAAILALGIFLVHRMLQKWQHRQFAPDRLFAELLPILTQSEVMPGDHAGSWKAYGRYNGHLFQFVTVVDTLATRKLPSLWLMVTLPAPQPLTATLDLVMRPTGPTTFSKFDFLPHTLPTPADFPEQAIIRTDDSTVMWDADLVRPHLDLFHGRLGKELLVSPKGLRLVILLAEADRARYGVLREADFGEAAIQSPVARQCMETLLALAGDIRNAYSHDHGKSH